MTQDVIRSKICKWHDEYLTPYSKIASTIGVSPQFIKMFVNGNRGMSEATKEKIVKVLEELGL